MYNLENELKIDIINQRQGENLARINSIEIKKEECSNQELIDQYNSSINELMAKNAALESLKEILI